MGTYRCRTVRVARLDTGTREQSWTTSGAELLLTPRQCVSLIVAGAMSRGASL